MTTTEHAAEIRKTLKQKHGWNGRQVSVRAEYFSLGSAIDVVVKDPAIPLATVKAIAEQAEYIRRCQYSGDILGGGNRYVHVKYGREAQELIGRRWADAVQRAVDAVEPGGNHLEPVEGTPFFVGRPSAYAITLWEDSFLQQAHSVDLIAQTMGNLMVTRECNRAVDAVTP